MKQIGLSYFDDTHLTLLAFIIFLVIFCTQIVLLYFKYSKNHLDEYQNLVFEKDQSDFKKGISNE